MGRRSVLVAAGWLGAAVLAVLVGLGAINVIGDGLTAGSGNALSPADVARQLSAAPSTPPSPAPVTTGAAAPPSSPASTEPSATTGAGSRPAVESRRGNTVVARCAGTQAEILTMTPALGFAVHEKSSGPQHEAEGEFRSSSDNHDRVKVRVTCSDGTPGFSWETGN
jgi:hypothetical protein